MEDTNKRFSLVRVVPVIGVAFFTALFLFFFGFRMSSLHVDEVEVLDDEDEERRLLRICLPTGTLS